MTIPIINLALTAILLILGIWAYGRKKSSPALLIGIAFGLFAISHLLTVLGMATALNTLLIIIPTIGYLVAILAVYRMGTHK